MRIFKNASIKIIERGEIYRPEFMCKEDFVLKMTRHNKLEVIKDAKRLLYCNPICSVFLMHFEGRRMEYEAKFRNDDGKFSLMSFKLRYCDYFPDEDPKKIEEGMAERIKFILLFLSAIFTVLISEATED